MCVFSLLGHTCAPRKLRTLRLQTLRSVVFTQNTAILLCKRGLGRGAFLLAVALLPAKPDFRERYKERCSQELRLIRGNTATAETPLRAEIAITKLLDVNGVRSFGVCIWQCHSHGHGCSNTGCQFGVFVIDMAAVIDTHHCCGWNDDGGRSRWPMRAEVSA